MASVDRIAALLERVLLRKGIGERASTASSCRDCRRTPLIGERLYHYEGGRVRCELCRAVRREEPVRWELVHGPEWGHAVRLAI